MKSTILVICTLCLVVGSYGRSARSYDRSSYRSRQAAASSRVMKNSVSFNDVKNLVTTIVENEHLNEIFSDVIGLNITILNDEIEAAVVKLMAAKSVRMERVEEILEKTSMSFQINVGLLGHKFKSRMLTLIMQGVVTDSKMAAAQTMKISMNTFCRRLINLVKTPEEVTKKDVVRVFETFLNTKLTSTIRDDLDEAKLMLGIYFLFDELNEQVMALAAKEGPAVEADLKNLFVEFEGTSKKILKPLFDLLKPIVLPTYEPELDTLFTSNALANNSTRNTELEDSEDNEIY